MSFTSVVWDVTHRVEAVYFVSYSVRMKVFFFFQMECLFIALRFCLWVGLTISDIRVWEQNFGSVTEQKARSD